MDTVLMDRAYQALCATLGEARGWEQIEPDRRFVPLQIQRKEAELVEAEEALDGAVTINEQARTENTAEAVWLAGEKVKAIAAELAEMREMFYQHPDSFEEA
jgi:hypothetical protein